MTVVNTYLPALAFVWIAALSLHASAQAPAPARRTVWSGIYTEAQAARGASEFLTHCQACHGAELGGGEGPALIGPAFMRDWSGLTLRELFHHVRVAMPEEAVSSVSDADKLDILTFIFQRNGFPAGREELTTDPAALAQIMFEGKDGPEPAPTGATVRVVGCLKTGANNGWTLEQASEPARTTLEARPPAEPGDVTLGAKTVRLFGVSPNESHKDQKVLVVGLMVRNADGDSVNVIQLTTVGPSCP